WSRTWRAGRRRGCQSPPSRSCQRSALDGPIAETRLARQRIRVQLVILLLVLGHINALADDVVLGPVEHEDRGARRDIGEALVDDQGTWVLRQADGVDVLGEQLLVLLHQIDTLGGIGG